MKTLLPNTFPVVAAAAIAAHTVALPWAPQALAQSAPGEASAPAGTSAPAPAPAPSGNPGAQPASGGGGTESTGTSAALDYLYNRKGGEGSAVKELQDANNRGKDKAIAMDALGVKHISDPQSRSRFERFLSSAEVPAEYLKAYAADLATVLELLRTREEYRAWNHLRRLAAYDYADAGVSWELANRVEAVWNVDKTRDQITQENKKYREEAERSIRSADFKSESIREKELQYTRRTQISGRDSSRNNRNSPNGGVPPAPESNPGGGGGAPSVPSVDTLMGKLEMTEDYLRSLEAKANIKLNDLKMQKLVESSKADFSEYISTLYQSGRYRHVLIAAEFWRRIFREGDYPVAMAQQVNASLEISREVQGSVDAFRTNLAENDVVAATERLQEAFLRSEFHPAILALPRAEKRRVEGFLKSLTRMQNLIEARDFAGLEDLLKEMKTVAPDYDATKPLAIVRAVKLESQLRLGKAKLAAQAGDTKTAMAEFQAAAEAWPGNPDLKDKALTFFDTQDVQNQSLVEFDRLVKEDNYRGIFEKQLNFAPAMKDDLKRQEQLKAALEKVKIAETATEKANAMRNAGDIFGAWETIELAVAALPNDLKLNAMRGELSGKAAEFVAAINKAKDAEARQDLGYSLTWFAIAQRQYPGSQIANQAVTRISKQILDKIN
ncbi:hypothetical protein DB346_07640 [Verrucomicrobia bacterium LW23]|nr:hypothetical protein DB346_07640 [Verrucomicrobia bacterium LW23]